MVNPDQDDETDILIQWGANNAAGAPLIGETILDRIERCDLFIADLSFVGEIETADKRVKMQPNSNVMLETGAASRSGGRWERMIFVLNTAFGGVESLPFDLKHRSCKISYYLAEKSDPQKSGTRQKLIKDFVDQIRPIYRSAKVKQAEQHRNLVAVPRRRSVEQEHAAFVKRLLDGRFCELPKERRMLALSVLPMRPPASPLGLQSLEDKMRRLAPLGGGSYDHRYRSKAFTNFSQERVDAKPVGVRTAIEITSAGNIFAAELLREAAPFGSLMIPFYIHESKAIRSLIDYLKFLKIDCEIAEPFFCTLSLVNIAGISFGLSSSFSDNPQKFDENEIHPSPIELPSDLDAVDYSALAIRLGKALRPAFNEFWNGAGLASDPHYDAAGAFMWKS